MPIKRTPEEAARPPLARGSACHRCFARKVRCSGQPDPASGVFACTSCLRTARFRNHDLAQAHCAFNGEGLCSEEGGPTLNGEVYPNVGPAPRRKLASRSTGSSRSLASNSSSGSSGTDLSSRTGGDAGSIISDASSTTSLKSTMGGDLSNSPEQSLLLPPPVTFQLPPVAAPAHFQTAPSSLAGAFLPSNSHLAPPVAHPAATWMPPPPNLVPQATYPQPPAPASVSPSQPQFPMHAATYPPAGGDSAKNLLSRRLNAPAMSISLPPHPSMAVSPAVSRTNSPAPLAHAPISEAGAGNATASAPMVPLQGWPAQQQRAGIGNQGSVYSSQQNELAGAMQSVLTPSTLAKLPTASHDFSLAPDGCFPPYLSGASATPSLGTCAGAQGYGDMMSSSPTYGPAGGGAATSASGHPSTPFRSLSVSEIYPSDSHMQTTAQQHSGLGEQWTGSFHLPSPGLTFSSSTPSWFPNGGGSQYFQLQFA
ncbi:transcription factor [Rhodotorula toruloides]|uniref:Transcription factor n=1 Tax=Rhodotorula toruloides TaxID=5286 RepID=A0A511KSU2_RHOTO|nr:transcription factor [Rhodotorula toruloides]